MARSTDPPPLPAYPPPAPPPLPSPRVSNTLPVLESEGYRPGSRAVALPPPLPEEEPAPVPPPLPWRRRTMTDWQKLVAGVEWLFGLMCLMGGLAALASIPILNFLSLGYLLEAGGRVAASGRLRDGFIGVRVAARLGGIFLMSWLFLLPVRLLADVTHSATIIDPDGRAAAGWQFALYVVTALVFFHLTLACARGGKLRYFLWPFNFVWLIVQVVRGGYYARARDAVWDFTLSLRLPHYFWLGFRGAAVAFLWLVVPMTMLALGHSKLPTASLVGFLGAVFLIPVAVYLPFLQLRMAATDSFGQGFNVLAVRRGFARAPWAHATAVVAALLFALPLYLFKIEIVPEEAAWIPGLIFIAFIYPARLLAGWAMGRAGRRRQPRHWFFRITGFFPLLPAGVAYVVVVFFSQYIGWYGVRGMYEQHAFLVPFPFFSM